MADFDVIVVGSGAAGAAASWHLAKAGFKVICLEQGDWTEPASYPTTKIEWELLKQTQYSPVPKDRNSQADYPINDGESPISICNFNAVGGSTILFSGHFPRFKPNDFSIMTDYGLGCDWPIDYSDLKPYFEINEHNMCMCGLAGDPAYPDIDDMLPPAPIGRSGEIIGRAFNELGWHWWPSYGAIATRNVRGRNACINLGPCNLGCPQGAKSSVDISYWPKVRELGGTLVTGAAVTRVLTEAGEAIGVEYIDNDNLVISVRAKKVVLAASAIGTPRILLNSRDAGSPNGLANSSNLVGKNLMLHPLGHVEGIFSEELDSDIGPQGCFIYSHEFYRNKDSNFKLGYTIHGLRGTGPLEAAISAYNKRKLRFGKSFHDDFRSSYKKQLALAIICEDLPSEQNFLELDLSSRDKKNIPGVKIRYSMAENTKKMMVAGMSNGKKLLKTAGAERVYAFGPVRNTGWHIMGTAKMGDNPKTSVVDRFGECHDVKGLYIADSSLFPTGSCVNPANTIQALSLYVSHNIGQSLT
jgi:choline dehydrogenase-like flavoprotein